MEKIYHLLPKHFLRETTPEEELIIEQYKKDHPEEYNALKRLWQKEGEIKIKDFDSQKAWSSVQKEFISKTKNTPKIIPFYRKFQNIAAAAVLLILATTAFFYLQKNLSKEVQYAQVVSTVQVQEVALSDGTKIWLNNNAKISYPTQFQGDTRKVTLEGEAFFEVAKNPNKPFVITTSHSTIQVLGTSFNVKDQSNRTTISVRTGKVEVVSSSTSEKVVLTPRQSAIVTRDNIRQAALKNENYLGWKTGIFKFTDANLSEVVKDLNTYYPKKIILKNKNIDCNFTATFDQLSMQGVIQILKRLCHISVIEKDGKYLLEAN